MNKNVNIAIVGLGQVGNYLYNQLNLKKKEIELKTNKKIKIVAISARNKNKKRTFKIDKKIFYSNPLKIFKENKIDILFECIGLSDGISKKIVENSLKNKIHVITPNKALIAKHGDILSILAEKNNVNLEFEAAVCGGVPIVRSLKEGLIANSINKIYGVFNGTTNFILTLMDKNNIHFNEALDKAKNLGYAETNPSSDLNGEDVASKLKILTALSFNSFINNKEISVEGINNIDHTDISNANTLGYKIKLVGISELNQKKVTQSVHPCLVKKTSYIAKIDGVLNAVITEGRPVGQTVIQGEGAGPEATASALVSDISSIMRGNIKFPFSISNKERKKIKFRNLDNKQFSAYLRLDVKDKHGVLSNITKTLSKNKVSIKRLIQNPYKSKKNSSIVIVTHKAKDILLKKAINQLLKRNYLIKKPKFIRIENI